MDFKLKIIIVTMLIFWGLCSPILGTRNNPQRSNAYTPLLRTKAEDLLFPSFSLHQYSASGSTQDHVFIHIPDELAESSQDHHVVIDLPTNSDESSQDHVIINIHEELTESSRDHDVIDIPEELEGSSRDHVVIEIPEELGDSSRDHVIIDISEELDESSGHHLGASLETLQLEEQSNVDSAPGTAQSSHSGFLSAVTTLMFATLLMSALFRCLLSTRSAVPIMRPRNMRLQQMRHPRRRPAQTRKHDHFKTT